MSARRRVRQLETCSREMFGDMVLTCRTPTTSNAITLANTPSNSVLESIPITVAIRRSSIPMQSSIIRSQQMNGSDLEKRRASDLVNQLLGDIYSGLHNSTDYNSTTSMKSHRSFIVEVGDLHAKDVHELQSLVSCLKFHVERAGNVLVRRLKRRDALRRQQDAHCDVITGQLQKRAPDNSEAMQFSIEPAPGESGFAQWATAMKMVAQLSGGIPPEFRRRLWLTLADRHLNSRGVNWPAVERSCFSEWSHPTDAELGVQIVKDLHRTGCSLFCGEDGQENQALLKRVLLAYARWNKAVGYCQGFNMLAALILQVTDKCETDALKLMIYLIEGVLPDSYFADSLRGLSVDMAVFRELLRTRLPRLSRHLDTLQNAARDGTTSYEPPLTNVFTMQWFLTLFCNCLPQPTVLRVWDLIMLEGNEILLRTALAIWQTLAERILTVRSADEFYCMMGVLTRELLEFSLIDANSLITAVVSIGPLNELKSLREHYLYNINPWGSALPKNIYSNNKQLKVYPKERLVLDISTLKKQYVKLKQRQRQAHIIFSAAISRQPPPSAPVAMNHLLLGKSALVPAKRIGPPKGAIPPTRHPPSTLLWKDTPKAESGSSSSSDTELCDDPSQDLSDDEETEAAAPPITSESTSVTLETASTSQFNKDNLNENLMSNDNIIDVSVPETEQASAASIIDLVNNTDGLSTNGQILVDNFLIDHQASELSDIFNSDPTTTSIGVKNDFDLMKYEESEDDDDSVDFEKFLEDRVRCLKEIDQSIDVDTENKLQYGRRNSERALQIIQENSLILHRILQCQSRLSPPIVDAHNSPTETTTINEEVGHSDLVQIETSAQDIIQSPPPITENVDYNLEEIDKKTDVDDGKKSPEYGSRYTSILEKSRSLDERYNSLILNANITPLSKTLNDFRKEINRGFEEEFLVDAKDHSYIKNEFSPETSPLYKTLDDSSYTKILDLGTENFNLSKSPEVCPKFQVPETIDTTDRILKDLTLDFQRTSPRQDKLSPNHIEQTYSLSPVSPFKIYSTGFKIQDGGTSSPIEGRESYSLSPILLSPVQNREKSPEDGAKSLDSSSTKSPKSPNRVFNPFPVSLSSRQSKEVPLKLGLYKK